MSDNSNNVHFSGVRSFAALTFAIKIGPCSARADNGKMPAANESYALKMNTIVIVVNSVKTVDSNDMT